MLSMKHIRLIKLIHKLDQYGQQPLEKHAFSFMTIMGKGYRDIPSERTKRVYMTAKGNYFLFIKRLEATPFFTISIILIKKMV